MRRPAWWIPLCFLVALLPHTASPRQAAHPVLPPPNGFSDDIQYSALLPALDRSLSYLERRPQDGAFSLGGRRYTYRQLAESLRFFKALVQSSPGSARLNQLISRYFDIYQASGHREGNPDRTMLVTGYYQPVLEGSLERRPPFTHPLYGVPADLVLRHENPGTTVGRFAGNTFSPYWTRGEIERNRHARGFELAWLKDPVDSFVLHVQGSGLIRLRDGSVRGIHYAINNGHPYRSIGRYMVETGRMQLEHASMETIRTYLEKHPDQRDAILHHNPSFIFFHWTDTLGAIGNLGEELVAGRSVAADQTLFPAASLAFLSSRRPLVQGNRVVNWVDLNRFVTVQDTGSAIRGPGRIDLYCGSGDQAGLAAGRMKEEGRLYFLLLKPGVTRERAGL